MKDKVKIYSRSQGLIFSFVSIVLLALVQTCLSGCDESQKEKKVAPTAASIKMGTSADMPPFEFYRTGEGQTQIVGYDIDLAREIGKKLGNTIEIKDMDFSTLIPALQAGRVDFAMSSITPTPERKKNIDFSKPYVSFPITAVTQQQFTVKTAEDLKGKKVGVQLGSALEQIAQDWAQKDNKMSVVSLNKLGELIQEVMVGRIDAVLMESAAAQSYVQLTPQLKVNPLPQYKLEFAVAFPKGSPLVEKFNKAIDQLRQNGQFEHLKKKWITKD